MELAGASEIGISPFTSSRANCTVLTSQMSRVTFLSAHCLISYREGLGTRVRI